MLLILPWIFMLVAIVGVILLWGDDWKETQYTIDKKEKERVMDHGPCDSKGGHYKIGRRGDCKCG